MPRLITCSLLLTWLFSLEPSPESGPPLGVYLKTRSYDPFLTETNGQRQARAEGRQRVLAQFTQALGADERELITARGGIVLGYIPDQAYVISVPAGFVWEGLPLRAQAPIAAADKWSPQLDAPLALSAETRPPDVFYLVLFHQDVAPEDARALALNQGLEVREHPNLLPGHLLVQGPEAVMRSLTEFDEVLYVLPASEDLAKGWPVVACENAMVGELPLSPLAAAVSNGAGWGNNRTATTLSTTWGPLSGKLDAAATRAEIERALAEWSRVVQVSFRPGTGATANRNLHILFGTRAHGDSFPFTGASGVIAHAFFPSPPNPEPIAGDIHFNDDMPFRIGADTDLFSVALHEIGHALGLAHMDTGNAVMYPYYRRYTALNPPDIAAIRQLYLSSEAAPAPSPAFRVTVNAVADTTAEVVDLAGTVENGVAPIRVQWANNRGGSGTVLANANGWSIRNVPLADGANQITLTATDAGSGRASNAVTVTRGLPRPPPNSPAPAPPQLRVTSPNENERTLGATVRVTGSASAPQGLRRVLWSTPSGSGQADGLATWTIPALPLVRGQNVVTLRAEATDGLLTTITLNLWRDGGVDNVAPVLTIVNPSLANVTTSGSAIVVSGAAFDAGGVAEVTWQNSTGGAGTAAGTTNWRAEIPVVSGFNTLTIRARDTSGNVAWRSLTVTRR
ncbi:MAG: matrixin family metalloprotease [Bryobacteraceae bacterium]|nr:matrixin family metalloprotease [Bryobacteraceae bacterium]